MRWRKPFQNVFSPSSVDEYIFQLIYRQTFSPPLPPKKLKPFLQKLLTSKNIRLIPSFLCRSHLLKEKITSFLSYLLSNYLQQVVLSVRRCTPIPYQKQPHYQTNTQVILIPKNIVSKSDSCRPIDLLDSTSKTPELTGLLLLS